MSVFGRILCAVNFTDAAHDALDLATALARDGGALEICHVFERERVLAEIGRLPWSAQLLEDLDANAEIELEKWRTEAAKTVPGAESRRLGGTSVWDAIVTEAERFDADLIIVGPGERRHGPLGSTAERVVRHAPCPVLVAAGEIRPFKKLLCAVDFSSAARVAMRLASALAEEQNATLQLVHASGPVGDERLDAATRTSAELAMRDWATEAAARCGAPVEGHVIAGWPADAVRDHARDGDVDLVVTGSHGRTGIARALLGSVVERIVRQTDRPVLVVRKPFKDSAERPNQ